MKDVIENVLVSSLLTLNYFTPFPIRLKSALMCALEESRTEQEAM